MTCEEQTESPSAASSKGTVLERGKIFLKLSSDRDLSVSPVSNVVLTVQAGPSFLTGGRSAPVSPTVFQAMFFLGEGLPILEVAMSLPGKMLLALGLSFPSRKGSHHVSQNEPFALS